jgi:lipooligosaccharide transport system ATP-binding protein
MRRVVLARALINEPDLLILDEPTTGLDPQSRHQIWERLEGLRARGISILLTTHYMEEASRLCDRLIIMDHGKILVEGRPQELLRERNLRFDDLGHRLLIYCDERDQLYREVSERYCRDGCTLRTATLEDVFLKLTGRELRE